jgi:alpha-glucosidase
MALLRHRSRRAIPAALTSPDRHISVKLSAADGALTYSITRDGKPVLLASELGLQLAGADLAPDLSLVAASKRAVDHRPVPDGGRQKARHHLPRQRADLFGAEQRQQKMDIVFRVSNDGVAFRYIVAEPSLPLKKLVSERTSFALPSASKAWLQPMSVAQTGWSNTNPSYEEHYQMEIPAGTKVADGSWLGVPGACSAPATTWLAISEANMDGSFQASRLAPIPAAENTASAIRWRPRCSQTAA